MFDSPVDFSNGYHVAMVILGIFVIALIMLVQLLVSEQEKRKKRSFDKVAIDRMAKNILSSNIRSSQKKGTPSTEELVGILEHELKVSANSLMSNNRFGIARNSNINYRALAIEILKVSIHSFKISKEQLLNTNENGKRYQIVVALSFFARSRKGSTFSKSVHAESVSDGSYSELESSLVLQRISYLTATRMIGTIDISRADKTRVNLNDIKKNLEMFSVNAKGMKYY